MQPIKCLIIDDEPLARRGIEIHIRNTPFLQLAGMCGNPVEALNFLESQKTDLLFLDIEMPGMNGLDFLKGNRSLPPVIITSAFAEHALTGYELDVLDYLIKPISFERFLKASEKAREFIQLRNRLELTTENYFFVKCDNKYEKIFFNDILFVEGMMNYVIIHTEAKRYITYLTMKLMEENLPADFIKVNKSFLVARSKIDRIAGNEICIGERQIRISRTSRQEVLSKLLGNRLVSRGR